VQQEELKEFTSGLEFDFSQWRTGKRNNFLELLGLAEKKKKGG
jgi:hypothetical protein